MLFQKWGVLNCSGMFLLIFVSLVAAFGQKQNVQRPTAAIGFTGVYLQDFQAFTGTSNTVADIDRNTMFELAGFSDGGLIAGWYVYGTSNTPKWGRNRGNNSTGAFYSIYETQSTPNRVFGSLASSASSGYFGVVLRNDTPNSIVKVAVSYDAFIGRNPNSSGTVNDYPVTWLVSSTAPNLGLNQTGSGTFNDLAGFPEAWHTPGEFEELADTLSFSTPSSGTGSPGSQNAIDPLFLIGTKMQVLQGIGWDPGQYLYLRWHDKDDVGSDALAGIDNFQISLVTTAADAVVAGQVVDGFGSGISGAVVTLMSRTGEKRIARTSPFGYFRFAEVESGETYVIMTASKRYRFEPRSVTVADNIDDLRIVALP